MKELSKQMLILQQSKVRVEGFPVDRIAISLICQVQELPIINAHAVGEIHHLHPSQFNIDGERLE